MFTAPLFTIDKIWKQPVYGQMMNQEHVCALYTHRMECYSAIKNEILLFSVTQMDLEDIMLSYIRQTENNK